jgi:O-antigen ligase
VGELPAGLGSVDHWLNLGGGVNALHSEMLRTYLDTGALGLTLFVAGLAQLGYSVWRSAGPARVAPTRARVRSALGCAALAYYVATLMTDNSLNYVSEFGLYVFALMGIALAPSPDATTARTDVVPAAAPSRRYPNLLR